MSEKQHQAGPKEEEVVRERRYTYDETQQLFRSILECQVLIKHSWPDNNALTHVKPRQSRTGQVHICDNVGVRSLLSLRWFKIPDKCKVAAWIPCSGDGKPIGTLWLQINSGVDTI
jgi:hypothetical protein